MKEFKIISSIGILLILTFSCNFKNSEKKTILLFEEASSDWFEAGDANMGFLKIMN